MPKTATTTPNGIDPDLPFEEAMARLETLVQGMESDQVPLDDLIKNYEEGTALYQVCEKRLDEAQGRIERIRKKRDGTVELEPFGSDDEPADESPPESAADGSQTGSDAVEDGELF